jgi:hypothetical protein
MGPDAGQIFQNLGGLYEDTINDILKAEAIRQVLADVEQGAGEDTAIDTTWGRRGGHGGFLGV